MKNYKSLYVLGSIEIFLGCFIAYLFESFPKETFDLGPYHYSFEAISGIAVIAGIIMISLGLHDSKSVYKTTFIASVHEKHERIL